MTAKQKKTNSSNQGRKRVKFEYQDEPGHEVYVAADFNDWKTKKLEDKQDSGHYSGTTLLPKGRYEYKFVVDGTWRVDPKCPDWSANDYGSINSVLVVE